MSLIAFCDFKGAFHDFEGNWFNVLHLSAQN
jgi:hypothetical protein